MNLTGTSATQRGLTKVYQPNSLTTKLRWRYTKISALAFNLSKIALASGNDEA